MKKCINCKKELKDRHKKTKRCRSCEMKRRYKLGILNIDKINNPNYIDGRYLKQYYCTCGKKIHYDTWKYGKQKCRKCSQKERYKNHIKYSWKNKKKNLNIRLREYLRCRIYHVLKGLIKSDFTMNLIGCNIDFLKKYLASKFTKGMSWKNYGKWHVDHIRPCASFDLSKPSEQRRCFHYTNLQPLWAKDNLSKGDKW